MMYRYILLVLFLVILSGCTANNQSVETTETDYAVESDGGKTIAKETSERTEGTEEMRKAEYKKITPEEAKEMMIEGNVILDVRTKEEYDQGYIEGARLLSVNAILDGQLESLSDKDETILVYCRSGNRSAIAAKMLVDAGYMNVYDFGGIIDWPYEILK